MPKVEKVEGGTYPLRITRRKKRQRSARTSESARVRVKCGCCKEAVDVYHDTHLTNPLHNTLEINGVMGTIAQWRQVFAPLLGFQPVTTVNSGVRTVAWESRID